MTLPHYGLSWSCLRPPFWLAMVITLAMFLPSLLFNDYLSNIIILFPFIVKDKYKAAKVLSLAALWLATALVLLRYCFTGKK